jgi:chloride channel 7
VAASPVVGLPAVVEAAAAVRVLRETTHNGFPVTLEDAAPGAAAGAPRTLDGFILRSQLLVLLRERAFCDARGLPLRGAPGGGGGAARDEALDARMRAAAASADGLGGAREQGVDPLAHRNDMATESELTFPALDSLDSLSSLGPARFGPAAAAAATAAAAAHAAFQPAANANVNDDSRPFLDLRPFMNRAPLAVRAQTPAARAHQLFVRESLRHLCVVDAHNRVRGIITRKDLQRAGSEPAEPAARGAGGTGWAARLQAAAAPPRRALSGVWRSLSPGDAVLGDERGAAVDAATSGAGCASGGRQRRAAGLEEAGGAGEPLLGAFGSALYSDA